MKDFDKNENVEEKPETNYIALEPRIAFDAAMAAEAIDEAREASQSEFAPAETEAAADDLAEALSDVPDPSRHVVFIDPGVEDIASLLGSVPQDAHLVFLDAEEDGVTQIADALAGMTDIAAVHIISHGEPGEITLGDTVLTADSIMGEHAAALAQIGVSLSETADIFIYGCDFGADAGAVDALAAATGADVAASDDLTGATELGGDWDLEVVSGEIEQTALVAENWSGVLGDTVVTGAELEAAAGAGSSFDVTGSDGNTITISRSDGGTITGEAGGAGLGRDFGAAADANPGASEDYTIAADEPLKDITVSFGFLNNNIDGEDQLLNFTARDADGNIISDAVFTLDDTSAPGGGGLFFVGQAFDTDPVVATAANGAVSIVGLPGSANVGGSASGTLTVTSASETISTIEFQRLTARGGQVFTGGFGVILNGLEYTTDFPDFDGDGTPDDVDLDDDNDGILDEDEKIDAADLTLNAPGFDLNTDLIDGSIDRANLDGLFDGLVNFSAELDDAPGGTSPSWNAGIQIQNDAGIGDFIFAQPQGLGGFPSDAAVYTFDFIDPVENLSLTTGGLNFGDAVQFSAFIDGVEVPISAANLTPLDAGVVVSGGDTLVGNATSGGVSVTDNRGRIDIAGPIDQLVVRSGKTTNANTTVTIGFTLLDFTVIRDTDGDGLSDMNDIDSDNDGITDTVEAQTTQAYIAPSGQGAGIIDANDDGVDDNFGGGFTPVDTDGDGIADFRDPDSDGDGEADIVERNDGGPTAVSGGDTDGDGLLDVFEGADVDDGLDVNDENIIGDDGGADGDFTSFALGDEDRDTDPSGADAAPLGQDFDFRDNFTDTDGDGVANEVDIDDDNDGILDVDEGFGAREIALPTTLNVESISPDSTAAQGTLVASDGTTGTWNITNSFSRPNVSVDEVQQSASGSGVYFVYDGPGPGSGGFDLTAQFSASLDVPDPNKAIRLTLFGDSDLDPASSIDPGFRSRFGNYTISWSGGVPGATATVVDPDGQLNSADGSALINGGSFTQLAAIANDELTWSIVFPDGATDFTITAENGARLEGFRFEAVIADVVEGGIDSDGDGIEDHLDIDKDNDGITDTVEAQATADYIGPSGIGAGFVDANMDGLDDNFDAGLIAGGPASGVGFTEVDTDGDGTVDTLDDDSDNDSFADVTERGDSGPSVASGGDTDGDGLLDVFEGGDVDDGFDVNDENLDAGDTNFELSRSNGLDADGGNAIPLTQDLDFRSVTQLEDDTATTDEDVPVTLDVLGNDDINSVVDPLDPATGATIALLDAMGNPVSGPVVVDGEGTFEVVDVAGTPQIEFTPEAGFTGTTTPVPYGIVSSGGTVVATANITVIVDAVPDPVDDMLMGQEDTDLPLDLTSNDDLGSGLQSLTIDNLPPASEGTLFFIDPVDGSEVAVTAGAPLTPAQLATLFFRPEPGFFGEVAPFDYTVTDTDGDEGTATVTITIDGEPEAQPDNFVILEDTPTPIPINANDDGGEPPFTFSLDSVPPTTQGTLTYTEDGTGNTITVDPDNPPTALSEAETSTLVFTPAPDFDGPVDPINYTVTDDDGDTSSATATLVIDAVPDPVADVLSTPEDTPLDLPITANDDTGDGLAAVVIDTVPPAGEGVLSFIDATGTRQPITAGTSLTPTEAATLRFDPAAGFSGPVTQLTYTIEDSDGDTGSTTLDIVVDGIPSLTADAITTQENTPVALDPLSNDTDFGDGFDVAIIDNVPPASQGTLTFVDDDTGDTVTVVAGVELSQTEMATLGFVPATGFNGVVDQIQYTVRDTDGDEASTTIDIAVAAIVDAVDDSFETPQDTDLAINPLSNDDPGGPDAVVAVTTIPPAAQGTLSYTDDDTGASVPLGAGDVLSTAEFATLVFSPATGFFGPVDPLDYTISDPLGNSDSATINIVVDGIPDAGDDVLAGEEDTPLPLPILSNDLLGDGPTTIRFDTVPPAAQGVLSYTDSTGATQIVSPLDVLTEAEVASLQFIPAPDFAGSVDPIDYTLIDSDGDTSPATISITIDATPDLAPDVFSLTEDMSASLPILSNDDLGSGVDTVTIDNLPPASEGVLQFVDSTGTVQDVVAGVPLTAAEIATLSFDPASNFFGPVTRFEYTVTDANGDVATTTVDITVDGLPEPVADVFNTDEDTPVVINIATNDDLGDGPATVALDSVPPVSQGTLTFTDEATGATVTVDPLNPPDDLTAVELATLTFTPAADFDGTVDPIAYTVTDADGDSASTTATIIINPLPDPVADSFTTNENTDVALDVLANDDTGDGLANLTIDAVPPASEGTLFFINPTNGLEVPVAAGTPLSPTEAASLFFRPAPGFSGSVSAIPYTITDLSGDSASSTIAIAVDAVPDPQDDTIVTPEDTPVSINVLEDNGAGPDDLGSGLGTVRIDALPPATEGVLTFTDATGAVQLVVAGAELSPAEIATLVFTPEPGFNGPVTDIPYTITDADGDTGSAVLSITVDGLPDLAPDVFVGGPNETIDTNFIANDPDFGDGFDFVTIPTAPDPAQGVLTYTADGGGTVIVSDGEQLSETEMATLQFDPNDTFFGAVDPITYTVTDIDGDVASSVANIFIDASTDVEDDTLLTKEDTGLDLNLLSNDEIADPDSTVTIGATIPDAAEGILTYVEDGTGTVITISAGETLSLNELSSIRFEPAPGFTGTVTPFNYTVTASAAGGGTTDTAGVTIVVDPVPEALNDSFTTDEDTSVNLPVNANDDNGTGFASIQFVSLPPAAQGVVFFRPGGTGAPVALTTADILTQAEADSLVFTPNADFSGDVTTFQYVLTDLADPNGVQDTDLADVDIFVDAVPDPVDDAFTVDEDTPLAIDILANDDAGDGVATVTFVSVPPAATGTLTFLDATGTRQPVVPGTPLSPAEAASLEFTPAPDFNGPIPPFDYDLTDTNGDTGRATVTLTMNPVPDVSPDAFSTKEDTPIAIDPTVNDLDAGDPTSTVTLTTPPAAQGILSYEVTPGNRVDLPAGAVSPVLTQTQFASLVFTPATDFSGTVDTIPYTVTDASGDTASTTISIVVDAVPDPVDDAFTVTEDTPLSFSVIDNDDQGDGPATVSFDAVPDPSQGTLTFLSDAGVVTPVTPGLALSATEAALLTFTPAPDFDGVIPPLTYTVTDANGDMASATLTLTLNPAPDLANDVVAGSEDTPIDFDPLANDPDLGDGPSTVAVTGPPAAQGTLSYEDTPGNRIDVPAGGTVTGLTPTQFSTLRFTPAPDFEGSVDPISYTVTDATGDTDTANIFVTIDAAPDPLPDTGLVETGIPFDLDILSNDDVGDGLDSVRFDLLPPAGQGTLTVLDGGVRRPVALNEPLSPALVSSLQFDPAPGFLGPVTTFTYVVRDTSGDEAGTTVDLIVDPAPLPQSDVSAPTANGTPAVINVVANDQDDPNGDVINPATVQFVGTANPGDPLVVPGEGTWTVDAAGIVTFTPEPNFVGDPSPVLYTVEDDDGRRSDPVAILADYVPVADDDIAANQPPGPVTIDVLANDVNGDDIVPGTVQIVGTANPGDPLVVPGEGTWSVNPLTGQITFTPEPGFTLDPMPISYTGEDAQGNVSNPALVTVDYAPVGQPDVATGVTPGDTVVIDVLSNDTLGDTVDPTSFQFVGTANPGDPLVVPGQGTFTFDPATGTVTFTPEPGFAGDVTPIAYTIADDEGNRTPPISITIDASISPVIPVDDPIDDPFEDDTLDFPVLSADPIIHDTATDLFSLNANTILFGDFPILEAINGLFSLGGMTILPTEDVPIFGGLQAPYPITMAVENVDPGFGRGLYAGLAEPLLESLHHKSNPQASYYFLLEQNRMMAVETVISDQAASLRVNSVAQGQAGAELAIDPAHPLSQSDKVELTETHLVLKGLTSDVALPVFVTTAEGLQFDGILSVSPESKTMQLALSPSERAGFSGRVAVISQAEHLEIASLQAAFSST